MRCLIASILGMSFLATAVWAGPRTPGSKGPLRCTLTDKRIEKCCCEHRDGKLFCTLAKKTIDKCCCVSAQAQKKEKS